MSAGKVLKDLGIGTNLSYEGSSRKQTLEGALRKRRSFFLNVDIFYSFICFKKTAQNYRTMLFVA